MSMSKKLAVVSALIFLQSLSMASAASLDDELARISSEKPDENRVEVFDPNPTDDSKNKSAKDLKEEQRRLEEERKEARRKIQEERKKSRDEITGKAPISKNPAPPERVSRSPIITTPPEPEPVIETTVEPVVDNPPAVAVPNPIVTYSSFDEVVRVMNFTPLYVPKKSGYTISSIASIDRVAEIRYSRRWEPSVSLHIRTYRRGAGEELKDISGVNGVKWRINVVNGVNIYIAKLDENRHVAAWAIGNYTFSAYVENLSFAAFHSFVSDELVDLSQHYYLN